MPNARSRRATEKIYDDDWHAFRAWCAGAWRPGICRRRRRSSRRISPNAPPRSGRSGLRLILAAIAYHHRRAGQLWTARDPVIATVMRGILRAQQRPERPAAALTSAELRPAARPDRRRSDRLADPAGLPPLRDRALLLTGLAGALRRSELVALDVEDVRFRNEAMVLRLHRSKGDQEGEGADVVIARGAHPETCPVRAMEAWLRRVGDRLWRGVPPAHRGRHDRGPADRQRRVEDPPAPGAARPGSTVDDDRAAVAARPARRLHHRGLSARRARRAGPAPRPPEEHRHHAALPPTAPRSWPPARPGCWISERAMARHDAGAARTRQGPGPWFALTHGVPDAGENALALPHTDWLRHDLVVTGPARGRGGAAPGRRRWRGDPLGLSGPRPLGRGPGRTRWCSRRIGSPGLTPAAARVLARQLRSAVETHHQRVLAAAGHRSRARSICTRSCRCRTTSCSAGRTIRRAAPGCRPTGARPARCAMCGLRADPADRRPRRSARLHISTSGRRTGRPGRCFAALRARYPTLTFDVRPDYGDD